eukprot:351299-Chlamydomonas_euryale.AAC.3
MCGGEHACRGVQVCVCVGGRGGCLPRGRGGRAAAASQHPYTGFWEGCAERVLIGCICARSKMRLGGAESACLVVGEAASWRHPWSRVQKATLCKDRTGDASRLECAT